jgi:hypothetical protein
VSAEDGTTASLFSTGQIVNHWSNCGQNRGSNRDTSCPPRTGPPQAS